MGKADAEGGWSITGWRGATVNFKQECWDLGSTTCTSSTGVVVPYLSDQSVDGSGRVIKVYGLKGVILV